MTRPIRALLRPRWVSCKGSRTLTKPSPKARMPRVRKRIPASAVAPAGSARNRERGRGSAMRAWYAHAGRLAVALLQPFECDQKEDANRRFPRPFDHDLGLPAAAHAHPD